jgi:hypothetical protein
MTTNKKWNSAPRGRRRHLLSRFHWSSHLFYSACHHILGRGAGNSESIGVARHTHLQISRVSENKLSTNI